MGRTGGRTRTSSAGRTGSTTRHGSRATTDHEEIQRWAEARGGVPACVKQTGGRGDTGMIRIEFSEESESSLQPISWKDWFRKFDENNLALLYQEKTASGRPSRFNKLVSRETAAEGRGGRSRKPRTMTAGGRGRSS